jgi:hypothetical protein
VWIAQEVTAILEIFGLSWLWHRGGLFIDRTKEISLFTVYSLLGLRSNDFCIELVTVPRSFGIILAYSQHPQQLAEGSAARPWGSQAPSEPLP